MEASPPRDHGDDQIKNDDQNEADIEIEKSIPNLHKCANNLKTGACTLVVLLLLSGFILIASIFGVAENDLECECANGQARACGPRQANPDIYVLESQTNLLDYEFNNIGVALNGYDVVQYSLQPSDQKGVLGCPEFAANLSSRISMPTEPTQRNETFTFWFKSAENRDAFLSSPWQFVPRYGGFGAYQIARQASRDEGGWNNRALGPASDPVNLWVRDNQTQTLYLFEAPAGLEAFQRDPKLIMGNADKLWTSWYGSLQAGPVNSQCFSQTWKCCRQCLAPSTPSTVFQAVPVAPDTSLQCIPMDDGPACPA